MARIERRHRFRSRRMENRVSIPLSGTNSLTREKKHKEELSQKRCSWTRMQSRSWESSSLRFRLRLRAKRSRPAESTPTSVYSSGKSLPDLSVVEGLSCLPYSNVILVESAVQQIHGTAELQARRDGNTLLIPLCFLLFITLLHVKTY